MYAPLISVVMPVYNSERFVEVAVNSILAQTYQNIEIICVNDCSKDNSLAVLNSLAKKDERVVVVDSNVNVGAGEARNIGMAKANGEYITFVDADDTIDSDLYEKVVKKLEETNADQAVWGLIEKYYTDSGKPTRTVPVIHEEAFVTNDEEMTKVILSLENKLIFGYQWNSFYRADIIKNQKIKFEKSILYEDFFFNLEFAKHMKTLAVLDCAGYNYFRRDNTSITHGFVKDYFDLSYRRIEEMYRFCADRGYDEQNLFDILGNRLLRYTFSALSRNHNPLSKMSFSDIVKWSRNVADMELYKELLPKCNADNPAHKVLKVLISKKCAFCMAFIGKIVYVLKK